VTTPPTDVAAVRDALEAAGFTVESAELALVAKQQTQIGDDDARRLLKMVDALEDDDDVQDVVVDVDIPDAVLDEQ
jgi:transcriptional/translational regulatory protein YebC/TACO1